MVVLDGWIEVADHLGCAMDLGRARALAGFADRRGRTSCKRNLESILLLAPHASPRIGPGGGSRARDGRLALRDVRQRPRSCSRAGAFDTRAPGMEGGRSRAVSSHRSKRNRGIGAFLRIAGTVVAAGDAELPSRLWIVRL